MYGKDKSGKSTFHASHHATAITFLLVGLIIITTGMLFVFTLILNQNHIAIAQQGQQQSNGTSFQMDNMTFSHHTASVNGIQLHYVIGGHGDPIVLLHGWPETWYEWRHVMPALAKNYTIKQSYDEAIDKVKDAREAIHKFAAIYNNTTQ